MGGADHLNQTKLDLSNQEKMRFWSCVSSGAQSDSSVSSSASTEPLRTRALDSGEPHAPPASRTFDEISFNAWAATDQRL
jgi:hypothetical protein